MLHNRVREWRLKQGFSQEETARFAEITRQALGQIEAEKVCPSTAVAMRLCRFLGCTVEELFYEDHLAIEAKLVKSNKQITNKHVYVSKIAERWVARRSNPVSNYDLYTNTHGIIQNLQKTTDTAEIQISGDISHISRTVFVSGCDVGLGCLAAYMRSRENYPDTVWFNTTNQQALYELENRQTHIASIHFRDESVEPYGFLSKWVKNLSCRVRVFEFAKSDIGWICTPENGKSLEPNQGIQLSKIRIVNRPKGAGARTILDSLLEANDISQYQINGYQTEVGGHLSVANAISEGFADAGIGHAAAAERFGLSFVPVVHERCVIIVREEDMQNQNIVQTLDTLCSGNFRKELASFGPYDTSNSGTTISVSKR